MRAQWVQGQAQRIGRQRSGGLGQRQRRTHPRDACTPGLATGRRHHVVPVRHALLGPCRIQLHLGPLGVDRNDRRHAQFGGLLQDQVHLLAAGDALQQGDGQRRFVVDGLHRVDAGLDLALAGHGQRRAVVMAVAIEQYAGISLAQAHHPYQVVGRLFRQGHGLAAVQRQVDGAAGHAHAIASSMAASVACASSSSCSSSTQ